MGRGVIVENLLSGKYKITRTYKTDYIALIAGWGKKIAASDKKLSAIKAKRITISAALDVLKIQLKDLMAVFLIDKTKVNKATADINKSLAELLAADASIAGETLKRSGLDEQLVKVKASQAEAAKVKEVWCATYSDQFKIGDKVDTIEIDDQSSLMLIAPEGVASTPGQLKRTDMSLPSEAFYNCAMLPGVQKWKPRYKFGIITAINKPLNLCTIKLTETSVTKKNTLATETLTEVPIDYLKCNSAVFNIGTPVVIEFTTRKLTLPRVIGFQNNPRPCLPLLSITVHAAGYADYIVLWDMVNNIYYNLGFSPPVAFPCKLSDIAAVLSSMTEIGKNLFTAVDAGFAIEDWEGKGYDCTIETPSNSTCHKITEVAETCLGNDGAEGLINRREVYRMGAYAINWYDEYHYIYDVIPLARRRNLQPLNVPDTHNLYNLYDIPFPSQKLIALNQSGYVGSAGTRFSTGHMSGSPLAEIPYPWIFRYSNYYGNTRYAESVTKQYRVLTPLGELLQTKLQSNWTQYAGGDKEYAIRSFEKAQGISGGQFTESVLTQFYLMQRVERLLQKTRSGAEMVTYSDRVVSAHAQTQLAAKGYEFGFKTSPYNSLGRNTALETAIQDLVAAWYAGNGLSATNFVKLIIEWKMIS